MPMPGHSPHSTNILFILTDDQGAWALGCAGNDEIQTPNLDRLAHSGIRFSNFFCASPVCSPARASILTGRIPSQHGVHDWLRGGNALTAGELEAGGGLIEYLKDQPGYTDVLSKSGWVCGLSGKWHLGDSHHPQKGFTYWEPHALGGGPYYNAPVIRDGAILSEPGYITDYITANALRFLEALKDDPRPFYLSVNYTAPHSPWEREQHPHELFDGYFNECDFHSIQLETVHPWQINSAPHGYTQEARRPVLSGYFSAVTAMDNGVGRLLDWLEAHGLRQDTLVIFSSDNGMNMGHHGIFGKGNGTFPANMYETSVKVPMLVSQPGNVPEGTADESLLSHYDLFPTLLEYAGAGVPQAVAQAGNLPGFSFVPLLRGQTLSYERPVVVFDEYGPTRMIRTKEWKYIHRYPYGPHELYDLVDDPGERLNLADSPDQQARLRELRGELSDWFARYSDPARDGTHEPVTGKGQLCLAGTAARGRTAFANDWEYLTPADPNQPRPFENFQKTGKRS
jgi:choline-sulfatase